MELGDKLQPVSVTLSLLVCSVTIYSELLSYAWQRYTKAVPLPLFPTHMISCSPLVVCFYESLDTHSMFSLQL